MNRLRDEASSDPVFAKAVDLLGGAAPLQPPAELRWRVRESLRTRAKANHPLWLYRTGFALFVLIASMTVATAMIGRAIVRHQPKEKTKSVAALAVSRERIAPAPVPTTIAVTPAVAITPAIAPVAAPLPVTSVAPKRSEHAHAISTAPTDVAEAAASASASPHRSDESILLLAGVQALRNAHQPERAQLLLKEYRDTYPNGAFIEEVLALSIEAAVAEGTGAQAEAAQYLARFPDGRFRQLAIRARNR